MGISALEATFTKNPKLKKKLKENLIWGSRQNSKKTQEKLGKKLVAQFDLQLGVGVLEKIENYWKLSAIHKKPNRYN